jgi:DNA gyrase subunit B
MSFLPDPEIFEKIRFKEDEIKSHLHETAYLNPESDHCLPRQTGKQRNHHVPRAGRHQRDS